MKNKSYIHLIFFIFGFISCFGDKVKIETEIVLTFLKKEGIKNAIFSITEWSKWDIFDFKYLTANGIFVVSMLHENVYNHLKNNFETVPSAIAWVIKAEELEFSTDVHIRIELTLYDNLMQRIYNLIFDNPTQKLLNQIKNYDARFLYDSKVFIAAPYENYTKYNMLEVYQVQYANSLKILEYGRYVNNGGLNATIEPFYKRRWDFNKSILLASYNSPDSCYDKSSCAFIELWEMFAAMMNFRTTYSDYWNMDRTIISLKPTIFYDIDLYDFVGPIFPVSYYMFIKDIFEEDYSLQTYISPFSKSLWICTLVWSGTLSFSLIIIIMLLRRLYNDPKILSEDFYDTVLTPFYALLSQSNVSSKKASMQIILFFISFVVMIITNSYSATFLSFIMVKKPKLPFIDLETFIKDGTYKLGAPQNTFPNLYFEHSTDFNMKTINERYLQAPNDRAAYLEEAVEHLCKDKKFVLIYHELKHYKTLCKILKMPKPVLRYKNYMPLGRSSPYRSIFNQKLNVLRSSGILKRMDIIINSNLSAMEGYETKSEVDFVTIAPIFYLLLYFHGICLVIVILEMIVYNITSRKQ